MADRPPDTEDPESAEGGPAVTPASTGPHATPAARPLDAASGACEGTEIHVLTAGEPQEDSMEADRPPLPPFTRETATRKVQAAEDAWNTCDPHKVALAYTEDSVWRNRDAFVSGREEIVAFLTRKWERELEYALRKNLWAFDDNRIAVRFQYESHDRWGQWWRSYGNELWEFDQHGLMRRREASINDVPIHAGTRRIFGSRPDSERSVELTLR